MAPVCRRSQAVACANAPAAAAQKTAHKSRIVRLPSSHWPIAVSKKLLSDTDELRTMRRNGIPTLKGYALAAPETDCACSAIRLAPALPDHGTQSSMSCKSHPDPEVHTFDY